jgi:ribosome-associated heat shock protein Hsp15
MSHRRDNRRSDGAEDDAEDRIRLDKWLWAARFFKTRALAAEAIAGGKVEVNGDDVKRARPVRVGDRIRVRLGPYEHHVAVQALSARRGPAAEAALLYEETAESREARERLAWQLKHASPQFDYEKGRPTKRDRREMGRWKDGKD